MTDRSAEFAKFLIEEYRKIPERDRASVVHDRLPDIEHSDFMRGFAIAEEIAVPDAMSIPA